MQQSQFALIQNVNPTGQLIKICHMIPFSSVSDISKIQRVDKQTSVTFRKKEGNRKTYGFHVPFLCLFEHLLIVAQSTFQRQPGTGPSRLAAMINAATCNASSMYGTGATNQN